MLRSRLACFLSFLIPVLLPGYYVSNIIFYWYEVLQKTLCWRNVGFLKSQASKMPLPKTWCFQNVLLINLSHCLTMVEQFIRLMVHSWSILWPSCTLKLLAWSLSPAIQPLSWCSTNLLFFLNHVKFYVIKTQHSSRYFRFPKARLPILILSILTILPLRKGYYTSSLDWFIKVKSPMVDMTLKQLLKNYLKRFW